MTRWLILAALLVAVALGAFYEGGWRAEQLAADQAALAAIAATKAERAALEADTKGRQEIARWKAAAARSAAEVQRLTGAAATAARDVRAAERAGETLVARGNTDEIMAALRVRGYHPERCRPAAVPVQVP